MYTTTQLENWCIKSW